MSISLQSLAQLGAESQLDICDERLGADWGRCVAGVLGRDPLQAWHADDGDARPAASMVIGSDAERSPPPG